MASPQLASDAPTQQIRDEKTNGHIINGTDEGVAAVEHGVQGLDVSAVGESALHKACAEGRLEDVREILTRSTEALESLDAVTGCTPIVLAIRNDHPEVVRELLSAGAIVPPPGVTNDQRMLSLLYPQPMYGMPPFMQHPHQPPMSEGHYYPQQPFYPSGSERMYMPFPPRSGRRESDAAQRGESNQANLPPADVAKTIPCRNFPNCKYGANCVFFHPRPNQFMGQPGFGYDQGFQGFQPGPGMYPQPGFGGFMPMQIQEEGQYQEQQQHQQQQQPAGPVQGEETVAPEIPGSEDISIAPQSNSDTAQAQTSSQPIQAQLNGMQPPFVPAFQQPMPHPMSPPHQPSQFGASPLSPSMLGASLPSIPPADQFFAAASPPNAYMGMPPPPFVPMPNRRQSFNQFGIPPNGMPIPGMNGNPMKPFGHAKKPSFSGGARPSAGPGGAVGGVRPNGMDFGKWKDGLPPPCAFFIQGKCRNGEMCKFPHLDAEGNDCRHPDIIRGNIPPMPALGRPPRPPRQFGTFDPVFKQQQLAFLQQQRAAVQQANNGQSPSSATPSMPSESLNGSQVLNTGETQTGSSVTSADVESKTNPSTPLDKGVSTLPPKPAAPAPVPNLIRSASQPGVQRVHANGVISRSQSPAPSNVSFHGNGHPNRRNGSRPPFAPMQPNGNRSISAESKVNGGPKRNQRVPSADEFPALGGMGGESKQTSPVARGRTAAEVLSAPAPEKPVVKVTKEISEDEKSADGEGIEMDSDNDSDGVVISVKPSSTTSQAPSGKASPAKRPSMSFASIASAISGPTETAPIAVKA